MPKSLFSVPILTRTSLLLRSNPYGVAEKIAHSLRAHIITCEYQVPVRTMPKSLSSIAILTRKPLSSYENPIVTRHCLSKDATPYPTSLANTQNPPRYTQIPMHTRIPIFHSHAERRYPYQPHKSRKYAVFRENGRPFVMRQITLHH